MRILYLNNCWFTNVGEAFIDIGAFNIINKIFDNPQVACFSGMSDFYANSLISRKKFPLRKNKFKNNSAKISDYLEADYVVMAGMFATEEHLNSIERQMVDAIVEAGAKLVLIGLGGIKYDSREREALARYYEDIKPALIVSRDEPTYRAYKDIAPSICGIDCAFWTKNSFNPINFSKKKYNVHTFNYTKEPEITDDGTDVVKAWHMQWNTTLDNLKENYFMSDTPYDYLTLYANADRVYTDLVHAVIPSLQYGTPVKYYYFDKRSTAFSVLEGLKTDVDGFMTISEIDQETQKDRIITEIKKII